MAQNFEILSDVIAKDPLAPTYRLDDPQWAAIVNWTIEALIQAEESGITQANLAEMKKSDDPVIPRCSGSRADMGSIWRLMMPGLHGSSKQWAITERRLSGILALLR